MSLKPILFACLLSLSALPAAAFGPETFQVRDVTVKNVFGRVDVTVVEDAKGVEARVSGPQHRLDEVQVRMDGGRLVIAQNRPRGRSSPQNEAEMISVSLTVPAGTGLTVAGFVGEGQVGDLKGPLLLDGIHNGRFRAGDVSTARLSIAGDADIAVGRVERDLTAEIRGDGRIKAGAAAGKVEVKISGDGAVDLQRVDGSLAVAIRGSGDVSVKEGRVDPVGISIVGNGEVSVNGAVGQPAISRLGGGTITINGQAR